MQRTTLAVFASLAIIGGIGGTLYYLNWLPQTPVRWLLLGLWLGSSIGGGIFVYLMFYSEFFSKAVEVNFNEEDDEAGNAGAALTRDMTVDLEGVYLNPFYAQGLLRFLVCTWSTSALIGIVIIGLNTISLSIPNWTILIVAPIIFVALWWPNQKPFFGHTTAQAPAGQPTYPSMHIPDDFVAIVTWLGTRLPIYLFEGDHPWLPVWFGFGVNRASLYGATEQRNTPVGERDGLVYIGVYVLPIWNSASDNNNIAMENVTRGGSTVFSEMLASFVIQRPLTFSKTTDAIRRIADQARAGSRKAYSLFRDIDVTALKNIIGSLIEGKAVYIAFTKRVIEHMPQGSVVHDEAGRLFADLAIDEPGSDEPYASKENLLAHIREYGHSYFFEDSDRENGEPLFKIVRISLEEKLSPVIRAAGGKIVGIQVPNITLSGTVAKFAQEAESIGQRRLATLGLAQAQKEARDLLKPSEGETVDETARIIALLQSGVKGARIVHNTGGDNLSRAAATLGTLNGNEGDE